MKSILYVLSIIRYSSLATIIAAVVFTAAIWLPNISLILRILSSTSISVVNKFAFLGSLYGSISTNFTVVSASYTILIAILFGINSAMFVYYIKQRQGSVVGNASITSLGGLISGFFGIGCAACGTFILTSVLGLLGASSILAFLPFGGEEFGYIGVALLTYSIYKTSLMIESPKVCSSE